MLSKFCSCKLFCCVSGVERENFEGKVGEMERPEELVAPTWWINHNKDICHIKNYYADRNHAELILFRQEMQIEDSCKYCLTCTSAKNTLNILKNIRTIDFGHTTKKLRFGRFLILTGRVKTMYLV